MKLKYLDGLDSLRLRSHPIYEPAETAIVKRELKSGDTFIDVGAHVGYYALLAAEAVGPSGRVFAFEPNSENFKTLTKNIEASKFRNICAVNKAASCVTRELFLYCNPKNTGDNRLFDSGRAWIKESVEAVTLDEYFKSLNFDTDVFIKIDTQGHEVSVLEGMAGILKRVSSLRMLVELFPAGLDQDGGSPSDIFSIIREFNFKISWPLPNVISKCTVENGRHCNLFIEH